MGGIAKVNFQLPPREPLINLDYNTLEALRRQHPAWRLLAADYARLVAQAPRCH